MGAMFEGTMVRPAFFYEGTGDPLRLAWILFGPVDAERHEVLKTDMQGRLGMADRPEVPKFVLDDRAYRFWYCFGTPPTFDAIPEGEGFVHLGRPRIDVPRNTRIEKLGRPSRFVMRIHPPQLPMPDDIFVLEADGSDWFGRVRAADGVEEAGAVRFEFRDIPPAESYSLRVDTPYEGGSIYYLFKRRLLEIVR